MQVDRAEGCLLGQLAGDALGSLIEFQSPEQTVDAYFSASVDDAIELARGSNGDVLAVNPPEPVAA